MAELTVDHLHTRYLDVDPAVVPLLDEALAEMTDRALADAMTGTRLGTAHAVCIPEMSVPVCLPGDRTTSSLAAEWARLLLAAIEQRVAEVGDPIVDTADGVVVYRRDLDAMVDMVRSIARGSTRRAWAWSSLGLTATRTSPPDGDDIAAMLEAQPALIAAVVAAAPAELVSVLAPTHWIRIARAMAALAPMQVAARQGARAAGGDGPAVVAAAGVVPAHVWDVARDDERTLLGQLAVACARPSQARDRAFVDRVIAAALQRSTGGRPDDVRRRADTAVAGPLAKVDGVRSDRTAPNVDSPADCESDSSEPADPHAANDDPFTEPPESPESTESSDHGGVFYLFHAATALDLTDRIARGTLARIDPREAVARIVAAVAEVPIDDAAVRAVAGLPAVADEPELTLDELAPDSAAQVAALATLVRGWVEARLDDSDLGWVFARRVTIDRLPGWVEATFALDDVDLRLRMAGLDLDPGFVPWRGAVVRFRHV